MKASKYLALGVAVAIAGCSYAITNHTFPGTEGYLGLFQALLAAIALGLPRLNEPDGSAPAEAAPAEVAPPADHTA